MDNAPNPPRAETARALAADLNANARTQADMARILERYLEQAHAQGWDACVEACCKAVCHHCAKGHKLIYADGWFHNVLEIENITASMFSVGCKAAAIRALKGGPK